MKALPTTRIRLPRIIRGFEDAMALPSGYRKIDEWRARWDDPENAILLQEVLKVLRGEVRVDEKKYGDDARLIKAGEMMKNKFPPLGYVHYRYEIPMLDLRGCCMEEGAGICLRYAHLDGAVLIRANLFRADLSFSKLNRAVLSGACLSESNLQCADLSNAGLMGAHLKGAILDDISYNRKTIFSQIDARTLLECLNPKLIRDIEDQQFLNQFKDRNLLHRILYYCWLISCDCGRSLLLWAFWSFLLAMGFGFIYKYAGQEAFILNEMGASWSWFAPFYYSIVTFTTLGFGDVTPKIGNWLLQMIVASEVILGYITLGGLISIFANKLARRS